MGKFKLWNSNSTYIPTNFLKFQTNHYTLQFLKQFSIILKITLNLASLTCEIQITTYIPTNFLKFQNFKRIITPGLHVARTKSPGIAIYHSIRGNLPKIVFFFYLTFSILEFKIISQLTICYFKTKTAQLQFWPRHFVLTLSSSNIFNFNLISTF